MERSRAFDYHPIQKKTTLANGVRVVSEHHPFMRTVACGVFIDVGTRDEPQGMGGAAHFLEHMVFKGTRTRSAFEIAKSLEEVGGDLNAYTSREYTCFHSTSLREHLNLSLDVLSDLVRGAVIRQKDFTTERQVVLHEIDMSVDDLEEYIFDAYFERAFSGHPLGSPILGTETTLKGMTAGGLKAFYKKNYSAPRMVVSVAGNVNHDEVVDVVGKSLGSKLSRTPSPSRQRPKFRKFVDFIPRPSEQVHVLMGLPSGAFSDRLRFESYVVSAILGGGMTARLYQDIREKLGLAYSVYSYLVSFTDSGFISIYGSTAPKDVEKVVRLMRDGILKLARHGPKAKELNHFLTQVKGQILVAADDVETRMNSLATNEMIFGKYRSVDEVIAQLDEVSVDSVKEFLEKYFDESKLNLLLVGDLPEKVVLRTHQILN